MNLLFKLLWWPWFYEMKIIKIRGWKTALVDTATSQRMTITPVNRKGELTLWGYLFEWFRHFKPEPVWEPPQGGGTM